MDHIDAKLAQSVVVLYRQHLLIERLIETRHGVLQAFEQALDEKRQALDHVMDVYNYVFALIDHLVRYQKIAFVLPRLSKKSAEYRALSDAMGGMKDIRNQLQHINNDIENDYTGPLLGAVCWVSGNRQFVASFHDVGRERSSPSIPLDTRTGRHLHDFCYVYNGVYHDLDSAIQGVRAFNKFVRSKVRVEVGGTPYDPKKHYVALGLEFRALAEDALDG